MPPIQDHPLRYALTNELHARPAPLIPVPATAVFLALKPAQDAAARDRALDRAHLLALLDRHGAPQGDEDLINHRFVTEELDDSRAPFAQWLAGRTPAPRVVFRSNEAAARRAAIVDGLGLGFHYGEDSPTDLIEVLPPRPEWQAPVWLVTHVDLHRTPKVQAAVRIIKDTFAA